MEDEADILEQLQEARETRSREGPRARVSFGEEPVVVGAPMSSPFEPDSDDSPEKPRTSLNMRRGTPMPRANDFHFDPSSDVEHVVADVEEQEAARLLQARERGRQERARPTAPPEKTSVQRDRMASKLQANARLPRRNLPSRTTRLE